MQKLIAAILKDLRILLRDKAALAVMFAMPILLVIVITSIQHSTFKMVNDNKVPLVICNRDGGESSKHLVDALKKIGMFDLYNVDSTLSDVKLTAQMHQRDALVAIAIPNGFSKAIEKKAKSISGRALTEFGMATDSAESDSVTSTPALTLFYNPVLQESFRLSVKGALRSAQQFTENRQVLQALYAALNSKPIPEDLQKQLVNNQSSISEIPSAKDGSRNIPNATQHNVPAWTIFAMFFIVVSLSTNLVKEKLSGSFVRLKTLPTNYYLIIVAKQLTYISVTLAQVAVIFSIGIFLFPYIGLPKLVLPHNLMALFLVSVMCGWCAVSYGVMIGVFAKTMEVAIGFGAVSVVILAAIGGIVVPSFAMPESLKYMMMMSPLHWCLEAYQTLFLGGGKTIDVFSALLPILALIVVMQTIAFIGLRRQRLV